MEKNLKISILILALLLGACTPEKKTLLEAPSTPEPEDGTGLSDSDALLYFQVGTRWEMAESGSYELAKTNGQCQINSTDNVGASKNCVITIPEAKLYYSDIQFYTGSTNPAKCPIVTFTPYHYQRSASQTFKPRGQTEEIDCSPTADEPNILCFGGAAPGMFTDYLDSPSRYFNTELTKHASFDLKSENSKRMYGGDKVNYLVTNNITDPTSDDLTNGPRARTGAEWTDYKVSCKDQWEEPLYEINIIIQDENFVGTGTDHFEDWP